MLGKHEQDEEGILAPLFGQFAMRGQWLAPNTLRFFAVLLMTMALSSRAFACGCGSFGKDTPAVDKVQSSWGPAEHLTDAGRYSEAIAMLHATARFLPSIHNAFTRACVASGANLRLVSAKAGAASLARNPEDIAAAKAAAQQAWIHFPSRHDCP